MLHAFKVVFANKSHMLTFIIIAISIFVGLVYIPVKITPANDLLFQLSIYKTADYLVLVTISSLAALLLTMQLHIFRQKKITKSDLLTTGSMGLSMVSVFIGSLFGTASCMVCLSVFFSFLGLGTILLLAEHRMVFVFLTLIIMLVSVYLTAKKINGSCEVCRA